MAGEGSSSPGAAVASEELGATGELGALKAPATPSAGGAGLSSTGGVATAVVGPVVAKLFGTDVDKIKLLEYLVLMHPCC